MRFDWRNPNHQFKPLPDKILNLDPYYYIFEKHLGKEFFFKQVLCRPDCLAIGDKCITADLVAKYVDT